MTAVAMTELGQGISAQALQAACSAALAEAGLPTAAEIATAVDAGAACASAIAAAGLPTAEEVADAVASSSDMALMVRDACSQVIGASGRTVGTGTATGATTSGNLNFFSFFPPGEGQAYVVYGWHLRVYGAASDVAIVSGEQTIYLGRSMPIGAVSVVTSPFPLYTLDDNAVITFAKTSGASVELTLWCDTTLLA